MNAGGGGRSTPTASNGKRTRSTPTGETPKQVAKRYQTVSSTSSPGARRSLFSSPTSTWTDLEEKALLEFVMLTSPESWPQSMKPVYWQSASEFVHARCGTTQKTSEFNKVGGVTSRPG